MLSNTSRWSHTRGNTVVPSRWQATLAVRRSVNTSTSSRHGHLGNGHQAPGAGVAGIRRT